MSSSYQRLDSGRLFWLLVAAVALCASCSTTPVPEDSQDDTGDGTAEQSVSDEQAAEDADAYEELLGNAEDLDAWFAAVMTMPDGYQPDSETCSSDLIAAALDAGEIDEEEYYLQNLLALYEPENLDEAYGVGLETGIHGTSLMRLIRQSYDTFSPEMQERLAPYLLSFDDPASPWYDPDQIPYEGSGSASERRINKRTMERPQADGSYFNITHRPGMAEKAAVVEEALEYAYDQYSALGFDEPTDWIRVELRYYLGDRVNGDEVMSEHEGHDRCHIRIKSGLDNEHLQAVAAHELFHCFQNYVEAEGDAIVDYPLWVWESTAVWAQEFVYPDTNTEHDYDNTFFMSLNDFFFDVEGTREYGSYPFWFHLYQREGKTGNVVRDMYFDIHSEGTLEALRDRPGFYEEFKEYALWNLNMDPFKYYDDFGDMPTGRPRGNAIARRQINAWADDFESVFVQEGGNKYFVFDVDDGVDRLAFDLTEIRKQDDNLNGVQVVYRIDGEWFYEDVSNRDELVFCRMRESEHVDGIIFITSNANIDIDDPDSAMSGNLGIDTTDMCLQEWHGYVECTWSNQGPGRGRGNDYFDVGDFESSGTNRIEETLLFDNEQNVFYSLGWTVTRDSRYEWYWENGAWDDFTGGTAWERRVEDISVSRSYVAELQEGCPPENCDNLTTRIEGIEQYDREHYIMSERSYRDLGTYLSVYSSQYVPGTLGLMQGHTATVSTDEDEHTASATLPFEDMELTRSEDGLRMTGTYVGEDSTCHAEYIFD